MYAPTMKNAPWAKFTTVKHAEYQRQTKRDQHVNGAECRRRSNDLEQQQVEGYVAH